jgi:hypothetical protein
MGWGQCTVKNIPFYDQFFSVGQNIFLGQKKKIAKIWATKISYSAQGMLTGRQAAERRGDQRLQGSFFTVSTSLSGMTTMLPS